MTKQNFLPGWTILPLAVCLAALTIGTRSIEPAHAETDKTEQPSESDRGSKTLGGRQFWTDYLLFRDWRIQRNAVTGHCRLLDGQNRRHCHGSLERCQKALAEIRQTRQLEPMQKPAVILLHGIADSRRAMQPLAERLEETDRYTVLNMSYASTRHDVAGHAKALASVVDHLDDVREFHLVGFSLGSIVIRHFLDDQSRIPADERAGRTIGRIVMIGPPNQGARIASRLGKRNALFDVIFGVSASQLGAEWSALEKHLAVPTCEYGIIAGSTAPGIRGNPLIGGPDDLVVAVEETKLPGASDFIVLPVVHAKLPEDPHVVACAANFLEHGYFVSAEQRQPIARDED